MRHPRLGRRSLAACLMLLLTCTTLFTTGEPASASPTDAFQIVYREAGTNHLLSVAYTQAGGWSRETVGIGLNMAADTSPGVAFFNNQLHVVYRAANGDLVNTYWTPGVGWNTRLVPVGPRVAGDVSATAYRGALHIVYRTTAGDLAHASWWEEAMASPQPLDSLLTRKLDGLASAIDLARSPGSD